MIITIYICAKHKNAVVKIIQHIRNTTENHEIYNPK